jgi:hypothetical protein
LADTWIGPDVVMDVSTWVLFDVRAKGAARQWWFLARNKRGNCPPSLGFFLKVYVLYVVLFSRYIDTSVQDSNNSKIFKIELST